MKRLFYLIDINVMRRLDWIPLANPPYLDQDLNILFESNFFYYLRKDKGLDEDLDKYYLWSIPFDKQKLFEQACKELDITAKIHDFEDYYEEFKQKKQIYKPSQQKEIPEDDCVDICEEFFPKIMCGPGVSQILLEHSVGEIDGISLYINSNEMTGHHTPHCHVKYNGVKNYCVLSLVDYKKIAPDGDIENAIIRKAQQVLKNNIQLARQTWNKIHSQLKFKVINGQYTSDYE